MIRLPVRLMLATTVLPLLSGCVAMNAIDLATAPVKIATRAVDIATVSQAESDQKRGREVRQREQRLGKLESDYRKQAEKCAAGDAAACRKRDATYAEMQALLPGVPVER